MKKNNMISLFKAINILKRNKIIIYPTESVFGFGCNPDSSKAIKKIIKIKKRSKKKGLILLTNNYIKLIPYVNFNFLSKPSMYKKIFKFYNRPTTLLLPAKHDINILITGGSSFVAVRFINYLPILNDICNFFKKPIISTSVNISGMKSCCSIKDIHDQFGKKIPILKGNLGKEKKTSRILNIITGEVIRND
ncbi:Sua5/YciO/YrdC/YwlC family protein [Buchnera aphidicola (Taiwanaphis decaspermi)]|uniref:Sua5/YciO/YrdC/YwlC family protein n=1 Tax=Buchnera aphidicola TaxID=9 RepID=UPI0031B82FEE